MARAVVAVGAMMPSYVDAAEEAENGLTNDGHDYVAAVVADAVVAAAAADVAAAVDDGSVAAVGEFVAAEIECASTGGIGDIAVVALLPPAADEATVVKPSAASVVAAAAVVVDCSRYSTEKHAELV